MAVIYPYRSADRQICYLVPHAKLPQEQVDEMIPNFIASPQERNLQTACEIGQQYPERKGQVEKLVQQVAKSVVCN